MHTDYHVKSRLYYDNSYLTEFQASVQEQYRKGDNFAIVLDQTAFYPTSGGQMHDLGELDNQAVLEVQEEGSTILHIMEKPLENHQITGRIDWPRRFRFMQQHTGFHILAQTFQRFRINTLSSHLGESRSTIDVQTSEFTWEKALEMENYANEIIFENRPVESLWVNYDQLESLNLRKFPPKMDRPIRLVSIKDFDLDPCGGTHVKLTGEVGLIKILSWEKVRGNIRCTFQAGWRALKDYQQRVLTTQKIAQHLSVTDAEMADEVITVKTALKEREKQIKKLNEELLKHEVKELVSKWEPACGKIIELEYEDRTIQEIKFLAIAVTKEIQCRLVIHTDVDPVTIILANSEECSMDLRTIITTLRTKFDIKGGGHAGFVEIHGLSKSNKAAALEKIKELMV